MNDLRFQKSEDTHLVMSSDDLPIFSSVRREHDNRTKTRQFVLAIVCLTVVLMTAVASCVALNEATITASRLKSEIAILEKQNKEYAWELEKKNDMVAFEQYAVNELGMLKGQQNPTDEREDVIE